MSSEEELPATEPGYDEVGKTILNNIYQQRSRFGHWKYYRAAAMLLLTLGIGWYIYLKPAKEIRTTKNHAYTHDIAPGENTATITFGNGKRILLSDKKSGVIVGSDLSYSDGSQTKEVSDGITKEIQLLTAATSRGGTYQVALPNKMNVLAKCGIFN